MLTKRIVLDFCYNGLFNKLPTNRKSILGNNSLNKLCVFTLTLLAHRSMYYSMRTLKSLKYVNFSEDCHWFCIISIRKYHCNPMNNIFYKLCEFGSTQTFLYI